MGVGPPALQELIFRHQLPGLFRQGAQHRKRLVGQMDRLLPTPQPLVPEVQTKGCEAEDALVPHSAPPVPRRATPRTDRARTGHVPRSRSGGTPRTIAGKSQTNLKTFLRLLLLLGLSFSHRIGGGPGPAGLGAVPGARDSDRASRARPSRRSEI